MTAKGKTSLSASARAGRLAKSFTDTIAPTTLQTAWALGSYAQPFVQAPHSSCSKWLNPIQRRLAGSITFATASRDRKHLLHARMHDERLIVFD